MCILFLAEKCNSFHTKFNRNIGYKNLNNYNKINIVIEVHWQLTGRILVSMNGGLDHVDVSNEIKPRAPP